MTREEALKRLEGIHHTITAQPYEQKVLSLGELYEAVRQLVEIYIADLKADDN